MTNIRCCSNDDDITNDNCLLSTSNIEFNVESMIGTAAAVGRLVDCCATSLSLAAATARFSTSFWLLYYAMLFGPISRLFPVPFTFPICLCLSFLKNSNRVVVLIWRGRRRRRTKKCDALRRGVAWHSACTFCLFVYFVLSPFASAAHPLAVNYYEDIHNQFNLRLFVYDSYSRTMVTYRAAHESLTWAEQRERESVSVLFRLFAWKIIVCDWLIHLLDLIFWWRWCAWLRTATCVFRQRQKALLLLLLLLIPIASSSHSSSSSSGNGIQNVYSRSMMHT